MKTKFQKYRRILILLLILSSPSIYYNIRQQIRWYYVLKVAQQVGYTGENQLTKGRIYSDPWISGWSCDVYLAFTVPSNENEFRHSMLNSSLPDKRLGAIRGSFSHIFEFSQERLTINGNTNYGAYSAYPGIGVGWFIDNRQHTDIEFYEVSKTDWQIARKQAIIEGNIVVVSTDLGTVPIPAILFGP